jgi:hypothetical protein
MDALEQVPDKIKYKSAKIDYTKLKEMVTKAGQAIIKETKGTEIGKILAKGMPHAVKETKQALPSEPPKYHQDTYWFNQLPPKKKISGQIFNQMDLSKGVRTSGKIQIEYTDKSGTIVSLFVYPNVLKYLSTTNLGNQSKSQTPGKEIRGVQNKKSWGTLISRRAEDDGWNLDNGKHVLDATYEIKWEILVPMIGIDTFYDGDGAELFGDYDAVWFKVAPPQSDARAFELYNEVDRQNNISTDGIYRGDIALLYNDKEGEFSMGYYDLSILQYFTQVNPIIALSKQLSSRTEIRSVVNKQSWGRTVDRRSTDDGWNLDTGRFVLDRTFNVKWEVAEPMSEEDIE